MKILLIGAKGQLGSSIVEEFNKNNQKNQCKLICPDKNNLNLLDNNNIDNYISSLRPDWIINAAAYTNVDKAEIEVDLAFKINRDSTIAICNTLKRIGGKLLHLSTDFVFDGESNISYKLNSIRNPLNIYGKSKSEGELAIETILGESGQGKVLRTSWLIGFSGKNFAKTILFLSRKNGLVKVISDNIGRPTTTTTAAKLCLEIIKKDLLNQQIPSIMHCSNSGIATWYDLAVAIKEIGTSLLIIPNNVKIIPIPSNEYPTKAKRPIYSALDLDDTSKDLNFDFIHWREALNKLILEKESYFT